MPQKYLHQVWLKKGEVIHIPEGGGVKFGQNHQGGTASVAHEGDPTKSGYLTFDPGGMSTINWGVLYQESESNKAYRYETNKSTKAILEMPQYIFPENFWVKVPEAGQSVCQVPSQLNIKEVTQLKHK